MGNGQKTKGKGYGKGKKDEEKEVGKEEEKEVKKWEKNWITLSRTEPESESEDMVEYILFYPQKIILINEKN